MKSNIQHKTVVTLVLASICLFSIIANIWFVYNFETTRRHYVENVSGSMLSLLRVLQNATCDVNNDYLVYDSFIIREIRLGQAREKMEGLRIALNSLSIHHNGRAGITGEFPVFDLGFALERIIRNDADPTTNLQVMTDIIGKLYLSIYQNMATRDLFANVNKASDEINGISSRR